MHTKNYVAFSEAIKEEIKNANSLAPSSYSAGQIIGIQKMALRTAEIFRKDNERFNVDQFLAASGVK